MSPPTTLVRVSVAEPPARVLMLLKVVAAPFNVPVFAAVTTQALPPLVAPRVFAPAPPAIEPLNVVTAAPSVKVSAPALPTSAFIEVAAMPSRLTAFAPVMLQALVAFRPVSVSVPVPPLKLSILLNVVDPVSVPALDPVDVQELVPSALDNVSVPLFPSMAPAYV